MENKKTIILNAKTDGLCGYVGFDHNGNRYELYANNASEAIDMVRAAAKPPKSKKYLCSVHLCERADGTQVLQSTCF